jgi:hypothetical protein
MRAVKTATSNHNFGPPSGKSDEIGDLPCEWREAHYGGKAVYSTWVPTDGERKAIAAGQNIEIGIGWIGAMPPISISLTPAQEIAS